MALWELLVEIQLEMVAVWLLVWRLTKQVWAKVTQGFLEVPWWLKSFWCVSLSVLSVSSLTSEPSKVERKASELLAYDGTLRVAVFNGEVRERVSFLSRS